MSQRCRLATSFITPLAHRLRPDLTACAPPLRSFRVRAHHHRLHPHRAYSQQRLRIQHSAFTWTNVAAYASIIAALGISIAASRPLLYPSGTPHATSDVNEDNDTADAMVASGRPGNLSEDEEIKLLELWSLLLQVTGDAAPQALPQTPTKTSSAPSVDHSHDEAGDSGKKRSRLSGAFFKKKPKDKESKSKSHVPSMSAPMSVNDVANDVGDDKHGTVAAFKAALAESSPAEIHEAFWGMVKHDHPDALLLRFLRARKWDVNAALVMAISALHWRLAESKVDSDIMINGEEGMLKWSEQSSGHQAKEGGDFMSQIRMGKSFLHGRDKEGRPICYVRVRLHKPGQECEEAIERFTVYTIETARMFLRPPVDTATIVFDMTDFGMSNMDYAPVKFMIKCFEANYPESLGVVLVHNAPWVFNAVWKIIKGWLDPVVASKIHFTNNLKDVEEFIERSQIIKELGGPMDWSYRYIEPSQGENASMKDVDTRQKLEIDRLNLSSEYTEVVQEWVASRSQSASEKSNMQAFRSRRDEVAAKLRKNYWQLDPYVRARSLYDRAGELHPDGAPASPETAIPKLNVPSSGENSARPSIDSIAQSFHTARSKWQDDVD